MRQSCSLSWMWWGPSLLRTRQQQEQQQRSASSTGVQQQMWAPPQHLQRSSGRLRSGVQESIEQGWVRSGPGSIFLRLWVPLPPRWELLLPRFPGITSPSCTATAGTAWPHRAHASWCGCTATCAWLSAPNPWSRGLRHQHGKSSATMGSARAVMQTTVAAMRRAAATRSR